MRLKAALLLAGSALTLAAHQILPFSLIHSEPAAGSVFADAPTRIRLIFGDKVDPSTARISLTDSGGQTITLAPAIDPHLADGIIAPVPPLKAGVYSVAWRVRSYGAEDISGRYTFAFGPHASLPSLPDSTQNQEAAGLDVSSGAQHAAELVLSLVLVGLTWLRYRSRGSRTP
jgi:methionine-rich copper-binding protein CopC